MSPPPGKRGRQRDASVDLSRVLIVVRRPLFRLVCSHAKNWGADLAHALSFIMNPLRVVM
jgi:hypothetical protein